jgi:hypothetical protein
LIDLKLVSKFSKKLSFLTTSFTTAIGATTAGFITSGIGVFLVTEQETTNNVLASKKTMNGLFSPMVSISV